MTHILRILIVIVLLSTVAAIAAPDHIPRRPRIVKDLDIDRICDGVWHNIARMPVKFQKDCACCATVEYRLGDDDKIAVITRCTKADGSDKVFEAEAEIIDKRTHARWQMAPFKVFGLKPVKLNLWFIGLGEDHAWFVVGTPDRDKGWIMSREPELTPEVRAEIDALLVRQGFAPDDFVDAPAMRP